MTNDTSPPLSIVIPTRNRATLLRRALDNVFERVDAECRGAEVIVIDGASTDGTIELLKRYSSRIAFWASERDRNVAEALNKGLRQARGRIIRGLGDDDEILPGGLSKMLDYLAAHAELDAVAGQNQVVLEDAEGRRRPYPQRKFTGDVTLADLRVFPEFGIFIPECMFFRREVLEKCGGYDEEFHYWGYLEYFFRLVKAGVRIRVIPEIVLITYQTLASDSIRANANPRWKEEWSLVQLRHNTLRWRIWHELGGTLSVAAAARWVARKLSYRLFGTNPRRLVQRIRRRFFGNSAGE